MLFVTMEHLALQFDTLMQFSVNHNITDIHFDPNNNSLVLRRHKIKIEADIAIDIDKIYGFLKFKSNIFLESFGNLQTGRFEYRVNNLKYYLRFAVLETFSRRHGVLRILNILPLSNLESCGIPMNTTSKIKSMFRQSHGLIIFCGKTGAGKSTTMFAALNELKNKEIFTLENPIEQYLPSLVQIECKDKDLNEYISQLLRHDPDILVIGEIRSSTELQQAIRASLSGHLLVTTLHAGSIDEVLLRLSELNISQFELKSVLKGIVFQEIVYEDTVYSFNFEAKDEQEISRYF